MESILAALWFVIGVASFVYWWTKDWDFELGDLLPALCVGLLGPAAFIAGWCIHGRRRNPIIIIRKRN